MKKLEITQSITPQSGLDRFFFEINKIPMISKGEEKKLAKRIKKGNLKARNKLCEANLRYGVSIAKKYQGLGISLPDLINEGNIGMLKATERFDETRGFKFISYATWWIRESIISAVDEESRLIKIKLHGLRLIERYEKTFKKLETVFERPPLIDEVAKEMGVSEKVAKEIPGYFQLKNFKNVISLDATVSNDDRRGRWESFSPISLPSVDVSLEKESLSFEIRRLIEMIPKKRDADILKLRFGIDCTSMNNENIAEMYNLNKDYVQQIVNSTLIFLRKKGKIEKLRCYLSR